MLQKILQRTDTYKAEHRHHLRIDLALVGAMIILVGVIAWFVNQNPSVYIPGFNLRPLAQSTPELTLDAQARYFAFGGEQIGTGAIPPRVGTATTYWIFVRAKVEKSSLQDGRLEVMLPADAHYTGRGSALTGFGWIASSDQKNITWYIGTIDVDQSIDGAFEVSVTPASDSLGTRTHLVQSILFTGTDIRGRKLRREYGPISGDVVR